MNNPTFISTPIGETIDVEVWLARAGLKFEDLGNDNASLAIRMQWREYQAAVHQCSVLLRLPPDAIQLSYIYAHLRIPYVGVTNFEINRGAS